MSLNRDVMNWYLSSPKQTPGISTVSIKVNTNNMRHKHAILEIILTIIAAPVDISTTPEKYTQKISPGTNLGTKNSK